MLKISDFDCAEPDFFRVPNLVDFQYFSIVFDIFRSYTLREAFENVRSCLRERLGVAWGLKDGSSEGRGSAGRAASDGVCCTAI